MTYINEPHEIVNVHDGSKDITHHIFDRYIDKMLARRKTEKKLFSDNKVKKVLAWLAQQMQQHGQYEFFLEKLQPDWLPSILSYRLMQILFSVSFVYLALFPIMKNPIFTLLLCVCLGIMDGFVIDINIEMKEQISWTRIKFIKNLSGNILVAFGFILFFSVVFGGIHALSGLNGFEGVKLGLSVGIAFAVFVAISSGTTNIIAEVRNSINQGVTASLKNALYFGIPSGIAIGIISLFIGYELELWDLSSLVVFLITGAFSGMYLMGIDSVLEHYILRILLIIHGLTPIHFAAFLDYASRLILLRKVGGSYMFIHRLLLEHFASKVK